MLALSPLSEVRYMRAACDIPGLSRFVIGACAALAACAVCPRQTPAPALAAVEQEIAAADAARVRALQEDDLAALSRLYADDFTMVTSSGEIRTKADQLRDIGSGRLTHPPAEQRTVKLRVYGDVALVLSESRGGVAFDGKADSIMRRVTRVYVRDAGTWQLVSSHISQVAQP